jgi:chromate reductase, NAD(P)H dehydrogenase (quinone)
MSVPVHVLLISGSLRTNSTNSAVVSTAAADAPGTIAATVYQGMAGLPHFNPDDDIDPPPAPVADLRDRIADSDAVLICTPEYAGALPGSFKNLLDWTVGGMAIQGKPVAWINASAAPTGAADAHQSLRIVLGYVDADIVEPACRHIAVPRGVVGPDGLITDPEVRSQIIETLTTLAHHTEAARARTVS